MQAQDGQVSARVKRRVVRIERSVLRKNETAAAALRERWAADGTFTVNVLSGPGSGKTTLLEQTIGPLATRYRVGVLAGDQATDNDAQRLGRNVPARQIVTAVECRLDAVMIENALANWDAGPFDLLLIENVGNLICPAEYDLGEALRVVLFSVADGEEIPLKYPLAFNTAHVALVTKIDLVDALAFDRPRAHANVQQVQPGVPVLELSARTGAGMTAWIRLLDELCAQRTRPREAAPA